MLPATVVGPTIIHHKNTADTYVSAMRCNAKNKSEIYILTDGKSALIAACLKYLVNVHCEDVQGILKRTVRIS